MEIFLASTTTTASSTLIVDEPFDTQHSLESLTCYHQTTLETIQSRTIQLLISILYTCTALVALIGNVIVIIVQCGGSTKKDSNIREYLINLALSDVMIGVLCVPFSYVDVVLGYWIFPVWLCPIAQFVQLWSVFVTAITLTIIGIERYIAAIHPFSLACQWFQTNGTKILLAVSWIIGALYANSLLESTDASSFTYGNNTYYECNYDNGLSRFKRRLFLWTNFVATFLLPAIILTFTYGRIMRHLVVPNHGTSCETSVETNNHHHHQQQQHHHHHHQHPVPQPQPSNSLHQHYHHHSHSHSHTTSSGGSNRTATIVLRDLSETPSIYYGSNVQCRIKLRRRSRTIRIILVVIIAYGVCWAPIKIFQLLIDHGIVWFCSEVGYFQFVYSYIACHWLSMANSCVNPIVYSYMSKSFRNDLRQIVHSWQIALSCLFDIFRKNRVNGNDNHISL
ncbi:hypothetical protein RDWZM_007488 [Blomia tropicalis]|uniref:G-protein coupled receptors family 1 profile domain-containing protein n=1 Tax=Blomia tropicalis TaxID=40697 RepID=A0A9Q0LZW4_BLOTA|nr:hypothetical protein RDWZM_007488 [Blomia tropicalis]